MWDTEFHAVQGCPIEVLLQTQCYHIMWECLYKYSSACRAIYLFATYSSSFHVREDKSSSKTMTAFKVGIRWREGRKVGSGKQSLT